VVYFVNYNAHKRDFEIIFSSYDSATHNNSFLKRAFKYGLFSQLFSFPNFADGADQTLFNSMLKNNIVSK